MIGAHVAIARGLMILSDEANTFIKIRYRYYFVPERKSFCIQVYQYSISQALSSTTYKREITFLRCAACVLSIVLLERISIGLKPLIYLSAALSHNFTTIDFSEDQGK